MNDTTREIIAKVQVGIPFRMLCETYLELFIYFGLNPEIGLDADALDSYSPAEFKEVARSFQKQGRTITFHGPFMDLSPGSPDPDVLAVTRRRLTQVIDLIPVFKPRTVVCHGGYDPHRYGFMQAEWLSKAQELWTWAAKEISAAGARLMLENVYETEADQLKPFFVNSSASPIGFCFDPGHQAVFSRTSMQSWLETLGPYLGQIHLHDNHGDCDAHLPMGKGRIDFGSLFAYLKDHRLQPVITLEPHVEGHLWETLAYLERTTFVNQ